MDMISEEIFSSDKFLDKESNMTKAEILKTLNEFQQEPVKNYHGASFVVAGPGSGKVFAVSIQHYRRIEIMNGQNR